MQKATQTAAAPVTRLIPLNKLRPDERNVRGEPTDPAAAQADAELVASIGAHGLLENLVVTPRTKTLFGVAAGARRLRALNALASEKRIPKNHPVPCLVVDNDAAAESSLAENAVRVAMHPADQVAAFSRLAAEGATAEQIAARFGVFRAHGAEARAAGRPAGGDPRRLPRGPHHRGHRRGVRHHRRRRVPAQPVPGARRVRPAPRAAPCATPISQRQTRSDARTALYVGLDAYRTVGGRIEDPLFEDDYVAILDPDLMAELAQQKLNAVAAQYADDWKWTAAQPEFTWMDQQAYLIADVETRAELTDAESEALDEAQDRIRQASAQLNESDGDEDDAGHRSLWDAIAREQARCGEIERGRAERDAYAESVRANAGVVVALDRDGNLDIRKGLVRAEDADAYRAARAAERRNGQDGATEAPNGPDAAAGEPARPDEGKPGKRNGGWTDALRGDLRVMRTAAYRRALARDPRSRHGPDRVHARPPGRLRPPPPGLRGAHPGPSRGLRGRPRLRRHEGERADEAPQPGARRGPRLAGR